MSENPKQPASYGKTRTLTRRRSPRTGGPPCGTVGRLRLPGNAVHRNHRIHSEPSAGCRTRRSPCMVGKRKNSHGGGARHVVCRQTRHGLHEARRTERRRRRLRQLRHDRRPRRPGRRRGRRSVDALVAERAGLALLRTVRPDPGLRTRDPAGGIRHGA